MPGVEQCLAGKTAIVTGAGSGLGRECAIALGQAGAQVILIGRTARSLAETQTLLRNFGGRAEVQRCDVTDDGPLEEMFSTLTDCDILINNAGTNVPQDFLEVTATTLDEILKLNVRAVFRASQCAARRMASQHSGAIVNMSSQMGWVGASGRVLYCMTKHAVEGLTKALALELAPFGVRVNAVAPTYVETPMTRPFFDNSEFRERVLRDIPLGRLATASEVAAAVLFLVSPGASMITGTSLLVDGGYTAR